MDWKEFFKMLETIRVSDILGAVGLFTLLYITLAYLT